MLWEDHLEYLSNTDDLALESKLWRMQNLYPIRDKAGRVVRFEFNKHQKKLMNLIADGIEPTILKSRQVGITTFWCIFFLDEVVFHEGVNAVILAHKKENVETIFRLISFAFENMPEMFKPDMPLGRGSFYNKNEIEIKENNSRISSKLEVRSESVTHVLFSEKAFMERERVIATIGSMPPKSKCFKVDESSPNGLNEFHSDYHEAKANGTAFFIPWFEDDTYSIESESSIGNLSDKEKSLVKRFNLTDGQIRFRRQKISEMGNLYFSQEYPEDDTECFLLSGNAVLDRRMLFEMKDESDAVISTYRRNNVVFTIFEDFKSREVKGNFFVGVDSSEGTGGDFSSVVIVYREPKKELEVVATIRGQEPPVYLARIVTKFLKENYVFDGYQPLLVVERNNHGHAVIQAFTHDEEALYENLYIHFKDKKVGFPTTAITRRELFEDLFSVIYSREIKINDEIIFDELMTLVLNDSKKIEAESGCHDDTIIGLGLAIRGALSYGSIYEDEDDVVSFV